MEIVQVLIPLILTIMVYTYLVGDNPVFRVAEHILVGVSLGWATVQIFYNILLPALNVVSDNLGNKNGKSSLTEALTYLIPLILGLVLLLRPVRAFKPLSNLVMALVIGTVSALSLAGALSGTLLPQIGAAISPLNADNDPFGWFGRIVLLIGTLASLWYFQFTVFKNRPRAGEIVAQTSALGAFSERFRLLGRWSIMLAFGAIFASVFLTYFAALIDRLLYLINIRF